MVAHTPNPSISEVEAGRGGGEFQASLIYLVRLFQKETERKRGRERKRESQAWWLTPILLAERLRLEGELQVQTNLGNITRSKKNPSREEYF